MSVKWLPNHSVAVYGYARKPVKLTWQAWMNWTTNSVAKVERAINDKLPRTRDIQNAIDWLRACGVDGKDSFYGLKHRLALLAQPGDPSRIVRCQCCNIALRDPVSKALGVGPVCRKGGHRQKSLSDNAPRSKSPTSRF